MEWVVTQEALAIAQGALILLLLLQQHDQARQRLFIVLAQPFAIGQDPIRIAARKQRTRIA